MKSGKTFMTAAVAIAGTLSLATPNLLFAGGGTAKGERTDQKGQQGMGLSSGQSSNVIMGGPDTVVGTISKIQGEQYSIEGDRGQEISLRVTKDTNMVCAKGQGTKFSTSREGAKETQEIAPTPFMEEQAGKEGQRAISEKEMMQQLHESSTQEEVGALSKDPSKLKDVVGSTDAKANEDLARGSGFVVGSEGGCDFKIGDHVRVEASDMGTATTIKQLAHESSGSAGEQR